MISFSLFFFPLSFQVVLKTSPSEHYVYTTPVALGVRWGQTLFKPSAARIWGSKARSVASNRYMSLLALDAGSSLSISRLNYIYTSFLLRRFKSKCNRNAIGMQRFKSKLLWLCISWRGYLLCIRKPFWCFIFLFLGSVHIGDNMPICIRIFLLKPPLPHLRP